MQYGSSVIDFSRSFKLLYVYQRLSSAFCILLRSTHCHTRFCRKKCFNFFFAHPGPDVRVQTSIIQGQARSACNPSLCNDVVRLHAFADRSGNHGQSSQCTADRPGRTRTRMPSDPLCVCQVHRNRPTVPGQSGPVSQSGGGPAPHRCFQAVPCSQTGHPRNPS